MIEETTKLIQPREHKAKVCIWSDLSVACLDRLEEAVTPDQLKAALRDLLHLEDPSMNVKHAILLDLYYYTVQFARQQEFSKEQTSAFFSIIKNTHTVCTETPFGNVQYCFNYFKELVLCHAIKRPPFSIDLFSAEEVRKMTEYTINTYFRHYKLYKYVFTPLVRLDLSMSYTGMPATPPPSEPDLTAEAADGETKGDDSEKTESPEQNAENTPAPDSVQETQEEQESPAASELRKLIRSHLGEELKKVKVSMEDQLKASEANMNKMLEDVEGSGGGKGRGSAKSKKK